jgi:hypothetical protein
MGSQITEARVLHATLCEIELGLFHVAYRMEDASLGRGHLPPYQVGSGELDAQRRVEQRALECGYELVVWGDTLTEPPVPQPVTEATAQLTL